MVWPKRATQIVLRPNPTIQSVIQRLCGSGFKGYRGTQAKAVIHIIGHFQPFYRGDVVRGESDCSSISCGLVLGLA